MPVVPPKLSQLNHSRAGRALLALVVVAVGVAGLLWWRSSQPEVAGPLTLEELTKLPTQAFEQTYPNDVFISKQPPRAVIMNNPEGVASNTFQQLSSAELTALGRTTSSSINDPSGVKQRQFLAQIGYSFTIEGYMSAVRKGDIKAINAFLNSGMELNTRNAFGSTALHAAADSNQLGALNVLLARGAELEATSTNLQTALYRAALANNAAVAGRLIEAGANTNATTLEGATPLFAAANNNNRNLAEMLLKNGANVNLKDRFSNTPLTMAVRGNFTQMASLLLKYGANPNQTDLTGRTVLFIAASNGAYQLAKVLLENGAKADFRDKNGIQPMDVALANNDLAIANLLLANGARRPQVLGTGARGIAVP
jgi:ankyrin repeat protein